MMNVKRRLKLLGLFLLILLGVAGMQVPLSLAQAANVGLSLSPATAAIPPAGIDVQIVLKPEGRDIIGTDFLLRYVGSDLVLSDKAMNTAFDYYRTGIDGDWRITFTRKPGSNMPAPDADGNVVLGTVHFNPGASKQIGDTILVGIGFPAGFSSVLITLKDQTQIPGNQLTIGGGTYTIGEGGPPPPGPVSCTAFSPNGLTDSGQVGAGGIKIYNSADYRGSRRLLKLTRSPSDAVIQPSFTKTPESAANLTFEDAADGSGNKYVVIPDNTSTTNDNDYTMSVILTSKDVTSSCTPFIIRVPKMSGDVSCPAGIQSTEARMRFSDNEDWSTGSSMTLGDAIYVAGFHNNQTDTVADDVTITATGPEGNKSRIATLDNKNTSHTALYIPSLAGKYTITVSTSDRTGAKCTGSSVLTVNATSTATIAYRFAENPTDLAQAAWQSYNSDSIQISDFEFKDKTPGPKFIFVQFMDSNGKVTTTANCPACQAQIKLLGSGPSVTGCFLSFEGNNAVLNLTGQDFGTVKGKVKSETTDLQVRKWKNDNIQAVWASAPQGQVMPVSVTNPDGQTGDGQCGSISQLALGAKVFCRAPSSSDTANTDLSLAGAYQGGLLVKQKATIDKEGIVQGLTQKLEAGKPYNLSIKTSRSLRRTVSFTAAEGITNIPDFILPVGDIFPAGGDGVINGFDHNELVRQWTLSGSSAGRSGDFNQDGKINSIDWACMRYDFGSSADAEAVPGGPAISTTPSPETTTTTTTVITTTPSSSPGVNISPSPRPSPTPLVSVSPRPSCEPRPACLDAKPFPCNMPEPAEGWCSTPSSGESGSTSI